MKTDIHFWSYLAQFFLQREMFQTKVVQKIKTHILWSATFFRKSRRLWDNVEIYGRAGQATDGNMALAHCVVDKHTHTHTHTHRICNTFAFPLQQWLYERASTFYVSCTLPVSIKFYPNLPHLHAISSCTIRPNHPQLLLRLIPRSLVEEFKLLKRRQLAVTAIPAGILEKLEGYSLASFLGGGQTLLLRQLHVTLHSYQAKLTL